MEEDERTKMLDHLQQYVPHLEKVIVQLKDPKRRNSELQVNKLEKLHSLITDRNKKLKLDTIRKCRDVMVKILHRTKLKAASPSPPQDVPLLHAPMAIPIKKDHKLFRNPNKSHTRKWDKGPYVKSQPNVSRPHRESYKSEKPDSYSTAAESLLSTNSKNTVVDRLGTKVDMSKPSLLAEDLQQLTAPKRESYFETVSDKYLEKLSIEEVEKLKCVLQNELQHSDNINKLPDLSIKLTRENSNKSKDKQHKSHSTIKHGKSEHEREKDLKKHSMKKDRHCSDNKNKGQKVPKRCIFQKLGIPKKKTDIDAEVADSKTKSGQTQKNIKEKHTAKEAAVEVKEKTKATAKEEIEMFEKEEGIPKKTDTKEKIKYEDHEGDEKEQEGEEENKENEQLPESQKILVRKSKSHSGQKESKKGKVLQSKQTKKTSKVNIKNRKNIKGKVQSGAKFEDNFIETVGERVKTSRQNLKTPETTTSHECRTDFDMSREDIKEMFIRNGELTATGKPMCRILKNDLEGVVETDAVFARNLRNRRTLSTHEEAASVSDSSKQLARSCHLNPQVVLERMDFFKPLALQSSEDSAVDDSSKQLARSCHLNPQVILERMDFFKPLALQSSVDSAVDDDQLSDSESDDEFIEDEDDYFDPKISPDNASAAIEESVKNGYEDIEVTDTRDVKNARKKFTYRCRFCKVFIVNESTENFFDHLTNHTGEYRFTCSFCPFKAANSKSLRCHMQSSHNATVEHVDEIMPTYEAPPNFHMVFGYICAECNFIQMDKTAVENHVKLYHLGLNKKIYKINMSIKVSKPTKVPEKKALVEEGEVSKRQIEPQVEQANEKEKLGKSDPRDQEVVKQDSITFKPNTDYAQDNVELDKQKHEKINEINKTFMPKKKVSSDPKKARHDAKSGMESNVEKPVLVNKTSMRLSNIIELMQGKLNVKAAHPPPLTALGEFKIIEPQEGEIVQVGPVRASKKNDYILYICYMPSCMFSSIIQSEFAIHCKNFHGNNLWDGFCNICSTNTNLRKVEEAYGHLLNMHINHFNDDEHTATTESSESQSKVKYLCVPRLSGDNLSTYQLDGSNNTNSVTLASDESLCKIVNVESQQKMVTEDTHSFPVPISNVTTLSPEKQQSLNMPEIIYPIAAVNKLVSTIPVINTAAGAGGITTVASTSTSSVAIPSPLQSTSGSSYGFLGQIMPPIDKCVKNDEVIQYSKQAHPGMTITRKGKYFGGQPALEISEAPACKRKTSAQSAQPTKVRIVERLEFEEKPRAEKLTARMSTTQVFQSRKSVFKETATKSTTQLKLPLNLTSGNRKSESD